MGGFKILLCGSVLSSHFCHWDDLPALTASKGILNQEELIKELAKALYEIAGALPQTELCLFLYPTELMRSLSSSLYALIIQFVQRAANWYSESKIKHAFTSLGRPHQLRFKDSVDDITVHVNRIYRLAFSMSIAELRETRLELGELSTEQRQIRLALDGTSWWIV
jgi:hypothetical protein